jgi:hypothetical protein
MRSSSFPLSSPAPSFSRLPLDEDDVALLFRDVHRRRNVVPPHAVSVKPTLVQWDPARALGVETVVVMEAGEAYTSPTAAKAGRGREARTSGRR